MTDRILAHLQSLVGARHPITSPEGLLQAERYLSDQFRQCGWDVSAHEFQAQGGIYRNVIADFPLASSPPSPAPLIIGAHYDTVSGSPGADDNASALAVLLAVAEQLSRHTGNVPVRFIAFCLEEEGLLGSLAYAAHLRREGLTIGGAIVLECVGFVNSQPGSQRRPSHVPIAVPDTADFLAVVGNEDSQSLVALFEQVSTRRVPQLKTIALTVPGRGELLPDTRRSDHAAFWEHGFPALMLTDTADYRNPHYHQPTDTLDTLNLDFIGHVAAAVAAVAKKFGGSETGE